MFTKQKRSEILERFENDSLKMVVANTLDKAYRFCKNEKLEYTTFLNIHELSVVSSILNELKIEYLTFPLNPDLARKVIIFVPQYIEKKDVFLSVVKCIKIIPKKKGMLKHKDYMGAIYNLGIKSEMIGDIICYDEFAYTFVMASMYEFLCINLKQVGNQQVSIEEVEIDEKLDSSIHVLMEEKEYIVPSLRIDVILGTVYNLSRNETKEKISKGDLFVNDKCEYYGSRNVCNLDIVSFRRCGKLKIGEVIRKTRSDNIVLKIYRYV